MTTAISNDARDRLLVSLADQAAYKVIRDVLEGTTVPVFSADLTFDDAKNIVFNTTTGTKIGTATGQKLAFYNTAPIAQESAISNPASSTGGNNAAIISILGSLRLLGLIAT